MENLSLTCPIYMLAPGSYREFIMKTTITMRRGFRPLTGIMSYRKRKKDCLVRKLCVSVPLRGLWFLSAPLINGFIAPSKMPFAGRIFFSPHFSHFCGK